MNARDVLTLKMLVSNYDGNLKADARIVGVADVSQTKESMLPSVALMVLSLVSLLLGFWLLDKNTPPRLPEQEIKFSQAWPAITLIVLSYVFIFLAVLRRRKYKRFIRRLWSSILRK